MSDTAPETIEVLGERWSSASVVERLEARVGELERERDTCDESSVAYKRYGDQMRDERDALLARVAELEDIDRQWGQTCAKALNERDAALAECERLRGYAQHTDDCAMWVYYPDQQRWGLGFDTECTCGLRAALNPTGETKP